MVICDVMKGVSRLFAQYWVSWGGFELRWQTFKVNYMSWICEMGILCFYSDTGSGEIILILQYWLCFSMETLLVIFKIVVTVKSSTTRVKVVSYEFVSSPWKAVSCQHASDYSLGGRKVPLSSPPDPKRPLSVFFFRLGWSMRSRSWRSSVRWQTWPCRCKSANLR